MSGLIEKWNRFAKKKIFINNTFEIGIGRLVYAGIIFGIQILWGFMLGAKLVEMMPSLLTWVISLKQKDNEKYIVKEIREILENAERIDKRT